MVNEENEVTVVAGEIEVAITAIDVIENGEDPDHHITVQEHHVVNKRRTLTLLAVTIVHGNERIDTRVDETRGSGIETEVIEDAIPGEKMKTDSLDVTESFSTRNLAVAVAEGGTVVMVSGEVETEGRA